MEWTVLQVTQAALLVAVAVSARLAMRTIRRPLLGVLKRIGGGAVGVVVATADLATSLVYLAYVAGAIPFETARGARAYHYELALDSVALFALVVAVVEVVSLAAIHRVAQHFEQWPPRPAAPSAA